MRIEILVDNEEPRLFSLNKPKLLIGSLDSCDIILNTNGVSRRHLTVMVEDDSYFVIDQGSTNGSFINEERLVPGRKTGFTTFFPVRLGDNVLITLLSDDEADLIGHTESSLNQVRREDSSATNPNATRAIPLSTLQNAKTNNLVKKRNESIVKRKAGVKEPPKTIKPKDSSSSVFFKIIPVVILMAAIYFNFFMNDENAEVATTLTPQLASPAPTAPPVPEVPVIAKVASEALTPKAKFETLQSDIPCTSDTEKYLCDLYATKPNLKPLGTVQVGTMVNSIFDGQSFYEKALSFVPAMEPKVPGNPDAQEILEYNKNVNFVTVLLFVQEGLPKTIDWEKLKDVQITFALKITHTGVESDPEGQNLIVAAFVPVSLRKFMQSITPLHFTLIKKYGPKSVEALKDYPVIY